MPHDAKGNVLTPGDKVVIPGIVKSVMADSDYCNVDIELEYPMPAYPEQKNTISAINTKQVLKVE